MSLFPTNTTRTATAWSIITVLAVALTAAGCSNDEITTSSSATTTTVVAGGLQRLPSTSGDRSTTRPDSTEPIDESGNESGIGNPGGDVGDYDGATFDFGGITAVDSTGGVISIEFDRYQLYADDLDANGDLVLKSGKDFTAEPIVYGNTDVPYKNDSPKLRRFVLSADVTLLQIGQPVPCASDEVMTEPVWNTITTEQLLGGAWKVGGMVSLSFGTNGLVSQVRLSSAC